MLELRSLIQQEIEANPTLEVEDIEPKLEEKSREKEEFREEFDRLTKLDDEWRDYMAQSASYAPLNIHKGMVTNKAVARTFGFEFVE